MVMVIAEFVLIATSVGAKAFVIVGGISTANVAVLDVAPVPPLEELTAPVVLDATPDVVSDTVAVTVQLPLVAMVAPLSTIDVEVEEATDPLAHVVATPV
jgi:hypothetical protein